MFCGRCFQHYQAVVSVAVLPHAAINHIIGVALYIYTHTIHITINKVELRGVIQGCTWMTFLVCRSMFHLSKVESRTMMLFLLKLGWQWVTYNIAYPCWGATGRWRQQGGERLEFESRYLYKKDDSNAGMITVAPRASPITKGITFARQYSSGGARRWSLCRGQRPTWRRAWVLLVPLGRARRLERSWRMGGFRSRRRETKMGTVTSFWSSRQQPQLVHRVISC